MDGAALLLAQRRQVAHLRGFPVEQQGCGNLSLAAPSRTDEDNIDSSPRRIASSSSQRCSAAHVREGNNQNTPDSTFAPKRALRCGASQTNYKARCSAMD